MQTTDEQIADLNAQIAALEAKRDEMNSLTVEMQVADHLHEVTCTLDHTERCGWHYGSWADAKLGYERQRFLNRAIDIVAYFGPDDAINSIDVIFGRKL